MRIAVHLGEGQEPVALRARVLRDDGARGVALRFVDVPMQATEALRKLVSGPPRIEAAPSPSAATEESAEVEEIVLTEILDEDEL